MNIEIIQAPDTLHALTAWRLSRNPDADYSINEVLAVDAPVNEMPSALLHFSGFTIIEREIFFSARNHVAWARTSRVDDPISFKVPKEFESLEHESARAYMLEAERKGVKQDEYRMALPLVAETSWTARMSMRDIQKMQRYFTYLGHTMVMTRFSFVAQKLAEVMKDYGIPLENGPFAKLLYEQPMLIGATGGAEVIGFTTIHAAVTMALRSQLVRHRELQFVDDFFTILSVGDWRTLTLNTQVHMQLCARNDVWNSILSHRACWIAQADLWLPITRQFDAVPLPCADGVCPFSADAEARLTAGADPNPPCPRYMNIIGMQFGEWEKPMRAEAVLRGGAWPTVVP